MLSITPSYANEVIKFDSQVPPTLQVDIDNFLLEKFETRFANYNAASRDLNDDETPEIILKRNYCQDKNIKCVHLILALSKEEIIQLGNIRALEIAVSKHKTNKIYDIIAFNNAENKSIFDIYMWSPSEKMYILKGEK